MKKVTNVFTILFLVIAMIVFGITASAETMEIKAPVCPCGGAVTATTSEVFDRNVRCTHVSNPTDDDMRYKRYRVYRCMACGSLAGMTDLGFVTYCYN